MAVCPEARAAGMAALEDLIASGALAPAHEHVARFNGALKGIGAAIAEPLARQREALQRVGGVVSESLARYCETV